MSSVRETFYKLIGNPEEFPLEGRILNSICILIIVVMGYNVPFSFYVGLFETGLICTLLFVVSSYVYYISRVKKRFFVAFTIIGVVTSLLFAVNYFVSSGMAGASLLSFTITLFLTLLVGSSRQAGFWVSFNLIIVLSLLTIEYLYPQYVGDTYASRLDKTIDLASTYMVNGFFLYFGTRFFRKAYHVEQKRVEERSRVLELLNEEKNKLFSIVSHDLRSPLASVQQYFEVLKQVDIDSEQRKEIESDLLDGINYTQDMLYNLLSWSASQMSGKKVSIAPVNLYSSIKPIIEIYKPLALKKEILLDCKVDIAQEVLADAAMLQLIIRNLVGNSIKFTSNGGKIMVDASPTGKTCIIIVKDNGRGMKEEEKDHVFSLKAQPTFGTNMESGVGLGLFLCKEYTELQHGTISFESIENVGTTFSVALPVPV